MERLETFWTWRSWVCAVCHGSHGTVGDWASWVVEAPRISLESADLCPSPLKEILSVLTLLKFVNSHHDSAWPEENQGHDGYGYITCYIYFVVRVFGNALATVPWCSTTHSGTSKNSRLSIETGAGWCTLLLNAGWTWGALLIVALLLRLNAPETYRLLESERWRQDEAHLQELKCNVELITLFLR